MTLETTSTPQPSDSLWKWWICGLLLLATTLNYMDRMALYQTSVRITRDLQINNQQYGLLESRFNIGFAIGASAIGWLVDRGNVRWIYPAMVLIWSAVGFATGFVQSFVTLLWCRLFLGLFEAGNWPCGIQTIRRVLKPEERSLGNGMFQSGTALGAIITPIVVLFCIQYIDPDEANRTAHQIVIGGAVAEISPPPSDVWRFPFRVIGAFGLLWVVLWIVTVRSRHIVPTQTPNPGTDSFWAIWKDPRFWVLMVIVTTINSTWRSFGFWLPKFLQEGHGYTEATMNWYTSLYFGVADLGSISVGVLTLFLARRGYSLHGSRLISFGLCACLTMLSLLAAVLPKGNLLLGVLLLIAFGSLGLFPTYFALSQEVSAKHQGKVTGTLGTINALYLSMLFPLQGKLIDQFGNFSLALGMVGVPPMIGFLVLWRFWKEPKPETQGAKV